MWPAVRSADRPSRPPSGRPSSINTSRSVTSLSTGWTGLDSKNSYSQCDDDNDDSSCDDTYVSMTPSRGQVSKESPSTHESPNIFRETSGMNWMNYSKSSPHSRSKTDISSPSGSSGILDKLKNDINRIELMRQSEFADEPSENIFRQRDYGNSVNKSNPAKDSIKRNLSFSSSQDRTKSVDRFFRDCESTDLKGLRASPMTNSFLKRDSEKVSKPYNVSALGKDESSIFDNRKKELPKYDRSKSVDRFFRDSEPTFMKSTRASILQRVSTKESKPHNAPTLGRDKPNYFEKKENELLNKLSEKDEEIKQVQDRLLKEKVEKEEMVKNLTSQISDTNSEINEARSNESKLKKTLLEVIKNLENERETKENEVLTSNSLQSVELKILQEELLCSAEKVRELKENEKYVASMLKGEIADKNEIISELESNLELLKTSLDQLMESKEDLEQTYCRKIEHLVMTLEEQKADEEKRIVTLEDSIRSNEKDWSNKVRRLEVENEQLQKSLEEVKKSLEDVKHSSADEFNILQTNLTQKIDALESEKVLMGRRLADMGKENKGQVIKVEKLTKSLSDSKSEHFETVNSLTISLEKTKEATAEIRSELSCKQMKLDSAISEVSNLTRKVDELMTEKKTLERDNEKLSTQVQAKNKQLEDTNKSNQELLTKIDDMKTEVNSFKQQNSKIRECEEQVKVLESSLDSSMTKSTIMGNEITSLQSDLKSANECLQVSKKKNAWLQKERDSLQEERDSLQKNIAFDASNAKDKESELQNKIQKLTSQKDSAEKKISELEKGMKKSKEDGKSRNEQLKSALSSLDEMMKYIESMREENDEIVKSLEVEIENVHTSKNEIEKEMKNRIYLAEKRENESKELIDRQNEENMKLITELKAVSSHQKIERTELDRLMKELEELQVNYESRVSELSQAKQSRETCELELFQTQSKIKGLHESLERSSSEAESLRQSVRKLDAQVEELKANTGLLCADKSEIDGQLKSQKKKIDELMSEKNQFESQLLECQVNLKTAMAEKGELSCEIMMKKASVDTLNKKLSVLQKINESLTQELSSSQNEVDALKKDMSSSKNCVDCEVRKREMDSKDNAYQELHDRLQQQHKNESKVRGELAQTKQLLAIIQSNEKHLEERVASLEAQISQVVSEYESKLEIV